MLVLTRRAQESVMLSTEDGTDIRVRVLGLDGSVVRLGFEAPASVRILRDDAVKRPAKVVKTTL